MNMRAEIQHASDGELGSLLWSVEDSDECQQASVHVESCELCQSRLEQLSGSAGIDRETSELLEGYPWHALSDLDQVPAPDESANDLRDQLDMLSPPSHPELLGRLGRYEVERVIGKGGMGIVLKAHDTDLNRPVAVKVLAKHLAHSGAARNRFARESRAAAAVVHEHVVAIHNVDSDGDVPFLVMQYVAGDSLQARVDRDGPLSVREILRIGIQAASGLAAAHEQGVVHRDVKPANILLESGLERAMLTDFGLARMADDASLTRTGIIAGTPHYMSPEQADGGSSDHRTDLFSLGSVLYFMATGHPPFRAERAMGVLHRICHDRQKPLWMVAEDVPDRFSVLVDRLLEKEPSKRPVSAESVHEQLTRMLSEVQQPRNGFSNPLRRWALRYPRQLRWAGLLFATVLLLVSAPAVWKVFNTPPHQPIRNPSQKSDALSAGVPPIGGIHSVELTASMEELQTRLDAINEFSDGGIGHDSGANENNSLQSLNERLDRLQADPFSESRFPLVGEKK